MADQIFNSQIKHLQHGVDVLVATPGRLIDLMNRRVADLSHVEVARYRRSRPHVRYGFSSPTCARLLHVCSQSGSRFCSSNDVEKKCLQLVRDVQKDPQLIEVGERN